MSRHYFDATVAGKPVTVIAGWDYTYSGRLFLDIQKADVEEEEFVYCSDFDPENVRTKTFDPFVAILSAYGITLPEPMIIAIEQDAENNTINRVTRWSVEPVD